MSGNYIVSCFKESYLAEENKSDTKIDVVTEGINGDVINSSNHKEESEEESNGPPKKKRRLSNVKRAPPPMQIF